jgi:hypothetical protein
MKMWITKMAPVSVTLAALVLVFVAVEAEQAAAEGLPQTPLLEQGPAVAPYSPPAGGTGLISYRRG